MRILPPPWAGLLRQGLSRLRPSASARALGAQSTALGQGSLAIAVNATALGRNAQALHIRATAIGVGATTTRVNQMVFGIGSNTYTAPGINSAASDTAQAGQLFVVTSDAAGNLATGGVIAPAALDGGTLAAGSVTSASLADDAVTENAIAADSVGSEASADGAVTAAKLGLANTAFVAADGATAGDNCDALIDALAEATGPAVVVLGPGIYDCGDRQVVVPAGVSLRGTDRKRTTISGSLEDPSGLEGLVVLGDGSVLSDLSVVHSGATDTSIAVSVPATSEGVEITDVRLSGGAGSAAGYAVMVGGGEVLVRASILEGGVGNDGIANIVNSQLVVSGATGAGAYRCVGAYDGAYSPLNSDCG